MQKNIAEILSTSFGIVGGIFTSLAQYSDELRTMKLAVIGAVTGFVISKILKWIDAKIKKRNAKV